MASSQFKKVNSFLFTSLKKLGQPLFYLFTFFTIFFFLIFIFFTKIIQSIKPPHFSLSIPKLPRIPFFYPFPLPSLKLTIFFALFFSLSFLFINFFRSLPSPTTLTTNPPNLSVKIYDRRGNLLYKFYQDENRTWVPLNTLPSHLILATLAAEDKNFYSHHGISLRGILRASVNNLLYHHTIQGGSTITQQLIKNTLLSNHKTLTRKLKEIILAFQVERLYSKNQILEMYLNYIPYGGPTYGIEEASQFYFGKHAADLNLAEAAFLAGLPQAPTTLSPYNNKPYLAKQRQIQVLNQMLANNFITSAQYSQALHLPLHFRSPKTSILAPHFVLFVKHLLSQKYSQKFIFSHGLNVYTTLDLRAQNILDTNIKQELTKISSLHVTNAAGLVINPPTGEILAMVGSKDYFDFSHDGQVNLTLTPRQPGSSVKPITYALAFQHGFTPNSLIKDEPTCFPQTNAPAYCPQNYDKKFHGLIPLRIALASSYNIPAVKLAARLGPKNIAHLAHQLGITTWNDPSRYGLSITLGSLETSLYDLATVYATFANQGIKVPLKAILKITDFQNHIILDNTSTCSSPPCGQQVLSPQIATQITNILSNPQNRAPAFGLHSILNIPHHRVAVKTGTSNNLRDNWTIGYTPNLLVGIWVGNNDNTPMSHIASGITGASPIWAKTISQLLNNKSFLTELPSPSSSLSPTPTPSPPDSSPIPITQNSQILPPQKR